MSFIFALKILFLMLVLYFSKTLFLAGIRSIAETLEKFKNDKWIVIFWGLIYQGIIIGMCGLIIKFAFGLLV